MNSSASYRLGPRIRLLRRQQQRLLRDIAGQCGFTVSLLSKIEAGKTTPPVATLSRIATALGVELADLLSEPKSSSTVFVPAAAGRSSPTRTDKGYGFHLMAASRAHKRMQPFLFVAERGGVKPGAMTHAGEEFVYILAGRTKYRVGQTTYTLGPGDSLYFDSSEEHDLEPITRQVRFLAVFAAAEVPRTRAVRPSGRRRKL